MATITLSCNHVPPRHPYMAFFRKSLSALALVGSRLVRLVISGRTNSSGQSTRTDCVSMDKISEKQSNGHS